MYKLIIQATTFAGLREKLFEAGRSIVIPGEMQENFAVEEIKIDKPGRPWPEEDEEKQDEPVLVKKTDVDILSKPVATPFYTPKPETPTRDCRGLPWDSRCHSDTKAIKKDGTWRGRRGVEQAIIDQIEAQLPRDFTKPAPSREVMPVAIPAVPIPEIPPVPAVTVETPPIPSFTQPVVAPVVQQPVAQPAQSYENIPIPAGTKPAHSLETFKASIFPTLAGLVKIGAITPEYIETLKSYFQLKEIWEISKDDKKVAEMFESFCANGLITKVG